MFKSHKIKIKTNSATLINISRNLKDISNSLKKDKTFTEKIKDRWWMVSLGSSIFMVGLLIGCYTYIFSGDVNSAVDYVQGYLSSGFYRIVFYLMFSAILLLAVFIIPSNVSLWFYVRHWVGVGCWRRVGWGFLSIAICIFFSFFASYICIFLLGGYHEGSSSFYRYVILSSLASLIIFFILYRIFEVNGSVKYRWINFLVFSLIMIVLTLDPSRAVPIILVMFPVSLVKFIKMVIMNIFKKIFFLCHMTLEGFMYILARKWRRMIKILKIINLSDG